MGEETSETPTEEEEEIEEYDLVEEEFEKPEKPIKKAKPEKTVIETTEKIRGKDFCPFCESEELSKDFKRGIYVCRNCGQAYVIRE